MKKFTIATFVAMGAVTLLVGCSSTQQDDIAQLQDIVENNEMSTVPERTPEINGVVASINGNTLVIKNEIGREVLTPEEQAAKRAERQKMTQEERQALRAQELANLETEDVTIEVPVGVVIVKGTGTGDGSSTKATFDEIKSGSYVSVWESDSGVEAIKIKGL